MKLTQPVERCRGDMKNFIARQPNHLQLLIVLEQIVFKHFDVIFKQIQTSQLRKWLQIRLVEFLQPTFVDVNHGEVFEKFLQVAREEINCFVVGVKTLNRIDAESSLVISSYAFNHCWFFGFDVEGVLGTAVVEIFHNPPIAVGIEWTLYCDGCEMGWKCEDKEEGNWWKSKKERDYLVKVEEFDKILKKLNEILWTFMILSSFWTFFELFWFLVKNSTFFNVFCLTIASVTVF